MTFMDFLQSFGAIALFTVMFAAILTAPLVSDERSFMRGLTRRVNDTIVEVTGTPGDQLSVRQFRQLVKSGERDNGTDSFDRLLLAAVEAAK
jgi:hypothetical protein